MIMSMRLSSSWIHQCEGEERKRGGLLLRKNTARKGIYPLYILLSSKVKSTRIQEERSIQLLLRSFTHVIHQAAQRLLLKSGIL